MGKYEPLRAFLLAQEREFVPMTFAEIERVIGSDLPKSKNFRAWWSNNPWNNVMTKEWLEAGYQTESVDVEGEKLVFRRIRKVQHMPNAEGFAETQQAELASGREPGFGFMKGLLTIEPGYDLTTPSSELWFEGHLPKADENG